MAQQTEPERNVATPPSATISADWSGKPYRETLAELISLGWTLCGVGDWALALRSHDGGFAARLCPFDPAYRAFLDLCRECEGNSYVPRVHHTVELDGGASVTVMEFLSPAPADASAELGRAWRDDDGDSELATLKAAAAAINENYARSTPWWDGFDLNGGNIRHSLDGSLKLIDIFCMDGEALYDQILEDADVVRNLIPESQCRYILEIPYLARECSVDELIALRNAWNR